MMSINPFAVLAETVPAFFLQGICSDYDRLSNCRNINRYNS